MKYEIWIEGCAITGSSALAQKLGECEADSFLEACTKVIKHKKLESNFNQKNLTWWGCRLFDNEVDAREAFG